MAVTLAYSESGGAGPPVVVLHGLFGAAANWATIARRLGAHFHVFAADLRNHGASPWADAMDYRAMAGDVAALLDAQGLAAASIIGHSMGGKAAMALALAEPARVARLVVVDIAPVARATALEPYVEAMARLDLSRIARRKEADAALAQDIPDAAVRAFLMQNLVASDGGLRWRINLRALDRGMAEIAGFPDFPAGTTYQGPTLVVRGERSDYVDEAGLAAFARFFPGYRLVTIAGASHWIQADAPDAFLDAVVPFLA
jgi:pimeloyl-ACP methyl ester carboxylesterase